MTIHMPDPFPGRCLNHRPGTDSYGYPYQKRCLDYEGHSGTCRFPEDPKPIDKSQQGIYQSKKPEPWVSPLTKEKKSAFAS